MSPRLIALLLLAVSSFATAQSPARQFSREELQRRRQQWFMQQRSTPQGFMPGWLRVRAIHQLDAMIAEQQELALTGAAIIPASPWTSIGPSSTKGFWGPATGRVFSLLVHPRNSSVVYAGTHGGGVWKTQNGGSTWAPLTDQQPSLGAAALVFDPNNADTIYVGTGVDYGAGLLKSTDGGKTWTNYPGPFVGPFGSDSFFGGSARISSIAVSPSDSNVALVGDFVWPESNAGVYRSGDGGKTWTQELGGTPGHTVTFDPANGNVAYAALCGGYGPPYGGFNAGIYKSLDAGQTWSLVTGTSPNVLPSSNQIADCQIAVQKSNSSTLFVTVKFTDNSLGLFKSTDAGLNWMRLPNPPAADIFYTNPSNPNILFAGGFDLYRSLDGGQTWADISSGANGVVLHPDQHSYGFSADASKLYVGNDGGISSTFDASGSAINWTNLNYGLRDELFYPGFAIQRSDKNIAFGGSQDNGMQRYSGNAVWNEVECGDGGFAALDPANPNNVYVACIYTDVKKSTTGGLAFGSFSEANTGIGSQRVTGAGQGLLLHEELLARSLPLFHSQCCQPAARNRPCDD